MKTTLQFAISTLISLCCLATAVCSYAQNDKTAQDNPNNHERWYQVEMIVFARPNSASTNANPEIWPTNISLGYPENLLALKTDGNPSEGFVTLAANERQLNSQAANINKNYTLLYHQAWRQLITAKKTQIVITAGKPFNGHYELEGSFSLSVGQFLKFNSNFWLTQFVPKETTVEEAWPSLPNLPSHASATSGAEPQDYLIKRIVKINQARSMRSQEIHYIDHPLLGIIIKIIPYDLAPRSNP